ncbi:MAG: PD40 domain-containing protein, partial [Planctomycetes bacterium]|nr:PD40 domain-containing protein [Planctomycetota bacterium]
MTRILAITRKDLRLILADRSGFATSLMVPIILAGLFGMAFSGANGDTKPFTVAIIDRDDSPLSREFSKRLDDLESIVITHPPIEEAREAVKRGKIVAAITLPAASSGARDVWIVDLARKGIRTRFTFDPANDVAPIWSPDGSRILFDSNRKGNEDLYQKLSTGIGAEEIVLETDGGQRSHSWSRDGRYLLYQSSATGGSPTAAPDLWVLPLTGDRKPFPLLQTQFNERRANFSPDGRW